MKILILLVTALTISSCSKIESVLDKAESIPGKMDNLSASTAELQRKEIVKTSVQELNDSKNYNKLSPIPTDIIPWAKKAAENMLVADELVPYIYIKLKDINTLRYDDNSGKPYDLADPQAIEFENNKVGLYNVLFAISGFLPEYKVDELLAILERSDEYSETILQILNFRVYFINNVLMAEKYKQTALVNLGAIEAAIKYNQSVERILRLPYIDKIKTETSIFVLFASDETEIGRAHV